MGSMVSFVLVLHSQEGEGFLIFHSGLDKMFLISGETGGTSQSEVVFRQVKRLLCTHIHIYKCPTVSAYYLKSVNKECLAIN